MLREHLLYVLNVNPQHKGVREVDGSARSWHWGKVHLPFTEH